MSQYQIDVIVGSLRKDSFNRELGHVPSRKYENPDPQ